MTAPIGAVILLHGRGATSDDILGLADQFDIPGVSYVAPQAPGNTWYPYSFLAPIEQNEPWLTSALNSVEQAVADLALPREKIVIAGFSQGACLASEFVARNAARYGGLIAFTGGLIGPPGAVFRYPGSLAGTPAFLGAGDRDPHVPWKRVQETAKALSELGAAVTLKQYPGLPHTINQDEIAQAKQLIQASFQ
jgi:phospholipase/carboxylesterase